MIFSLFYMFAKIGIFGFGGGYAMLPFIFQTVQQFGSMSAEEFSNLVALSQVTPGPLSVNAATYVGFLSAGVPGACAATVGIGLPSFTIVILVSKFLEKFKESKIVEGIFLGIRPATVGLIVAASIFLAETSLVIDKSIDWIAVTMFLATLVLVAKFKISPIEITLIMAAVGAVAYCI